MLLDVHVTVAVAPSLVIGNSIVTEITVSCVITARAGAPTVAVVAGSYWILPRCFVPRMWSTDSSCGAKQSIMHIANATFNEVHQNDQCYAFDVLMKMHAC